jgi:hypothetical protein
MIGGGRGGGDGGGEGMGEIGDGGLGGGGDGGGEGGGDRGGGEGGGGEGALRISRVMSTTSTVQRSKPSPCAFSMDSLTSLIGSRMMHSGE